MNVGPLIGIGIGLVAVAIVVGGGSTLLGLPETNLNGIPETSNDNKMQMTENIEVKITKSNIPSEEESSEGVLSNKGRVIEISLKDGAGTGDR